MIANTQRYATCVVIALFLIIVIWRPANPLSSYQTTPKQTNSSDMKEGIDVSHYQGKVDWSAVTPNVGFVFLKATDGITYQDPRFTENATALKQQDRPVGAYHFFEPADDGVKQADNFLKTIKGHHLTMRPVIDVEISKGHTPQEIADTLTQLLHRVETKTGCKPIIYSNANYWETYLGHQFDGYPFWLADYSATAHAPADRKNYLLWQYTQTGHVQGLNTSVDKSRFTRPQQYFNDLLCQSDDNLNSAK